MIKNYNNRISMRFILTDQTNQTNKINFDRYDIEAS